MSDHGFIRKFISGFFRFFIILLFFFIVPLNSLSSTESEMLYLDSLAKRLIKDGFDEKQIQELFRRPEVRFDTRGVSLFSVHQEAKLNYGQFLSSSNIEKARQYMMQHQTALQMAERMYGVEKEVITAIMLVETRLGTYLGGSSILNSLSTMAALSDPESRDFIWNKMSKTSDHTRSQFNSWSDRKTDWAYNELKAFITYTQQEAMDPLSISGSYAGALGICQFMPSNVLKIARDGNLDGRINLFDHSDAIASIANYLKVYGWGPGLDRDKQYQVLLRYNYSKPYADTLIDIAQLLKG
ncbi:MAG: protein MltB [Desulfobacterium sp.]|nr:protein MltB [Desulfobacterium sp.]